MNAWTRGLSIFLGSAVAAVLMGWLLFSIEASVTRRTRLPALPFALPLVGMLWGPSPTRSRQRNSRRATAG